MRYQLADPGVIQINEETQNRQHIYPGAVGWSQYEAWIAQHNVPEPPAPQDPVVHQTNHNLAGLARAERQLAKLAKVDPVAALRRKVGI